MQTTSEMDNIHDMNYFVLLLLFPWILVLAQTPETKIYDFIVRLDAAGTFDQEVELGSVVTLICNTSGQGVKPTRVQWHREDHNSYVAYMDNYNNKCVLKADQYPRLVPGRFDCLAGQFSVKFTAVELSDEAKWYCGTVDSRNNLTKSQIIHLQVTTKTQSATIASTVTAKTSTTETITSARRTLSAESDISSSPWTHGTTEIEDQSRTEDDETDMAPIIGGVVAGLIAVLLSLVALWKCKKRKQADMIQANSCGIQPETEEMIMEDNPVYVSHIVTSPAEHQEISHDRQKESTSTCQDERRMDDANDNGDVPGEPSSSQKYEDHEYWTLESVSTNTASVK